PKDISKVRAESAVDVHCSGDRDPKNRDAQRFEAAFGLHSGTEKSTKRGRSRGHGAPGCEYTRRISKLRLSKWCFTSCTLLRRCAALLRDTAVDVLRNASPNREL